MNNISQIIPQEDFFNYISSTERESKKLTRRMERWVGHYLYHLNSNERLMAYQYTSGMTSLLLGIMIRYLIWVTYKAPSAWTWAETTIFFQVAYRLGTNVYPMVRIYMNELVETRNDIIIEEEEDKTIKITGRDLSELMNQIFEVKEKLTDEEYKNMVEILSDVNNNKEEKQD